MARRLAQPFTSRGSIVRYHATLGWENTPGAQAWLHRSEYSVHLEFNSHGMRGPERSYQKPAGVTRTLLLGDSYTEGYTVPEPDSVRAVLERELTGSGCSRHEVFNGGPIGYSTDQEYFFYLDEGRRFSPDVTVVLFCWNDLYFNTTGAQGKPYFDVDGDSLVLRNSPVPRPRDGGWQRSPEPRRPRLEPWRGSMALRLLSERTARGNFGLHRLLARLGLVEPAKAKQPVPPDLWPTEIGHDAEVEDMWRTTGAILRALKRDVEKDGGRLALLYIPERHELTERDWNLTLQAYQGARRTWRRGRVLARLRELCQREQIPLLDPSPALAQAQASWRPAYFPEDGHWTEVGHAVAAHELARFLRTSGWLPCATGSQR